MTLMLIALSDQMFNHFPLFYVTKRHQSHTAKSAKTFLTVTYTVPKVQAYGSSYTVQTVGIGRYYRLGVRLGKASESTLKC